MVHVQKIIVPEDLQKAFAIRDEIFVHGQNVPARLEHEHDDVAHHFLATVDGVAAGAARWRRTEYGYKLERFAVLTTFRRQGVAAAMIRAVLADLPPEADYIYLHAQLDAVSVYEQNGFVTTGDPFEEAGIQHFKMIKRP